MTMMEVLEGMEEGVRVGGVLISDIRFADDQGMVASTEMGLQRLMDRLNAMAQKYSMKINIKKTKTMVVSKKRWWNCQYHDRWTKSGASQNVQVSRISDCRGWKMYG